MTQGKLLMTESKVEEDYSLFLSKILAETVKVPFLVRVTLKYGIYEDEYLMEWY
jgi:hypothetical protein